MTVTGGQERSGTRRSSPDGRAPGTVTHTAVVGAGVAGLAVTRMLDAQDVPVLAFDRNDGVADVWRERYDGLRLNSVRWLSQMPDMPLPRRYGRWVTRDQFVEYLTEYAEPVRRRIRTGIDVRRIRRGSLSRWELETDAGMVAAHHVVLCTGLYRQPWIPDWPGRGEFHGRLEHASAYRRPSDYEGEDVVVVGAGVSGVDIASALLGRGSGSVTVAVRTSPHFLPREMWGVPLQNLSVGNRYLPLWLQDIGGNVIQRLSAGDLSRTALGRPRGGMFTRLQRTGVSPSVDDGVFLPAVRSGRIRVIGEVTGLHAKGVVTADGEEHSADTVLASTGYRTGLDSLLESVPVLDSSGVPPLSRPATRALADAGLHFVGYVSPLTGHLREIGLRARWVARAIAAEPR
ncbi:flavin-containing monooxygenase [Nocardiopsis alborubida]|uniref:NAD(P)/FAD-dependent oxidoreductase n=2 Tax=Nocardiopsis alborubida TaxID=146802 RepID=A0A7X6M9G7_9ACTN|nr:NAD(P)/FAD-dependent oxidoreductase [Nocardiopsis alborubida]NKY97203.1 NAD(P)/FAD-dependent oxidoreductase [Nocardiopsis alborubida]